MGILDTHADGIRSSFEFDLRNPQATPNPGPSFSAWSFAQAGFSAGPKAGAQKFIAATQDLIGGSGFGEGYALTYGAPALSSDDAKRASQSIDAGKSAAGFGRELRASARDILPDPTTSHRADQVFANVTAGMTQAVPMVGLGGAPGAVLFGAVQGDDTYQELVDKGVDKTTALKVAGVTGTAAAVTAGLPVGGSTVRSTIALGIASGPGAYVLEQSINRKILESAGYHDEARLHDPTDPLGLALSVLLPGVMGGIHARGIVARHRSLADIARELESGGKRYGQNGELLQSNKGALGEMQVMPATAADPGFGIKPAALGPDGKPTPDELARVGAEYIVALSKKYGNDAEKTLAAYNAGPGKVDAAIKEHGPAWLEHLPDETRAYVKKGMEKHAEATIQRAAEDPAVVDAARVRVLRDTLEARLPDHPDAVPALGDAFDALAAGHVDVGPPTAMRSELEQTLASIEAERAQLLPVAGNLAEPGAIRQARQEMAQLQRDVPDTSDAAIQARAKEIQAEGRVSYKEARAQASKEIAETAGDFQRRIERLQKAIDENAQAQQATQRIGELDRQHAETTAKLAAEPLPRPIPRPTAMAASEALMRPDSPTLEASPVRAPTARPAPNAEAPRTTEGTTTAGEPTAKPAGEGAQPQSLDMQRAEAALLENPELTVMVGDEAVPASEALAQARRAADIDRAEGGLFQAAVQCFLSFV